MILEGVLGPVHFLKLLYHGFFVLLIPILPPFVDSRGHLAFARWLDLAQAAQAVELCTFRCRRWPITGGNDGLFGLRVTL